MYNNNFNFNSKKSSENLISFGREVEILNIQMQNFFTYFRILVVEFEYDLK